MNLLILDTSFNAVSVVEGYESFIWTDRYNEYGDFEIVAPISAEFYEFVVKDYYLWSDESEHLMIIEDISIDTDVEDGNHFTVTGRSLESILDRRVVWGQTLLNGNLQSAIKKLITDAIISPSISARKISNFVFSDSTDTAVTSLKVDTQYTGDNLYTAICDLCKEQGLGFKIILNDDLQFVFSLYAGVDRSYEQTDRPYVIFSENFENIINSNYYESVSAFKNVALIGGEGEGTERKYSNVTTDSSVSGLSRREMFVDAREISSKVTDDSGNETTLTDSEYTALLDQKGNEKLSENGIKIGFEGEVDTTIQFVYREDFDVGDIVQIHNAFGKEGRSRVDEVVISHSTSGFTVVPTFTAV